MGRGPDVGRARPDTSSSAQIADVDTLLPLAISQPDEALATATAVIAEDTDPRRLSIAHQAAAIVQRDRGRMDAALSHGFSAVRLARFNVESVRDEGATKGNPYFTGLPTPAAACMMLLPLLLSFQWNGAWARDPALAAGVAAITAFLMVSRLPTPSIKYMKLQRQHRTVAIACFAGVAALLIVWPWATLTVGLVLYIASIPLAIGHYHPRIAARRAG